ncbi:MAG: hypothetical protein IMY73_00080 [Bacteroidetes bacterium]|nr:hypothetical protein [Bacteroidota bacterium]
MEIKSSLKKSISLYYLLFGFALIIFSIISYFNQQFSISGMTLFFGIILYIISAKRSYYIIFEDNEFIVKNFFRLKSYKYSYKDISKILIEKDIVYGNKTLKIKIITKSNKPQIVSLGFISYEFEEPLNNEFKRHNITIIK